MRLLLVLPAIVGTPALLGACVDAVDRPHYDHVAALLAGSDRVADPCALLDCGGGRCDAAAVSCECGDGERFDGLACVPLPSCGSDADCLSPHTCLEARCSAGTCTHAPRPGCTDAPCPTPRAPVLEPIAEPLLTFATDEGLPLQVRWETLPEGVWIDGDTVPIGAFEGRAVRVQARVAPGICPPAPEFEHSYVVTSRYPGPPGTPGSDAIGHTDAQIAAWASSVHDYVAGAGVDPDWRDPALALGPASSTPFDVVSLGEGGVIELRLAETVADGDGHELAVFENAFDDRFLELARVGVSSDGSRWAYFDGATRADGVPDPWRMLDPQDLGGFAGRFRAGWGTPFDLAWLRHDPHVLAGDVDLTAIRYVRIEDIVGDGGTLDSFARPIVDPWPSEQTAGFDLDAVAVMAPRRSR